MLWLRLAWPKIYFHVRSSSSPSRRYVFVLACHCIYIFWNKNQNNTIKTFKTFECELIEMILFYFSLYKESISPTPHQPKTRRSRNPRATIIIYVRRRWYGTVLMMRNRNIFSSLYVVRIQAVYLRRVPYPPICNRMHFDISLFFFHNTAILHHARTFFVFFLFLL